MLHKLSYLNLFLAIVYGLIYLKSGTFNSVSGILMIIIFNWLALRSYQLDNYKWKLWHYSIGLWILYYLSTLFYGFINILGAVFEFDFMSNDTASYLTISFTFCLLVITQLFMYMYKNYKQLKYN
ncbi:hypothetical protein SAMN04489864_105295 [Pedobacter insulae]|uniref:Uncharacterized protein n=1 Tax=Pedobacter insulae TaxID=414048 RepID=A0A1I2XJP8_9SPHI|nr:hypothetical protein SAMN04489864_105295 [Pedobacter insulae]